VQQPRSVQQLPDPGHERFQQPRRPLTSGDQEPGRHLQPTQLAQQPGRPPIGQVMPDRGQHTPRRHRRAPLHPPTGPPRRPPHTDLPTTGAQPGHHLELHHPRRRRRRRLEHLPLLHPNHQRVSQVGPTATTPAGLDADPLIGVVDLPAGHPRFTALLTRLAARAAPQPRRLGVRTIRRRRTRRVGRIHPQPATQLAVLGPQPLVVLPKRPHLNLKRSNQTSQVLIGG